MDKKRCSGWKYLSIALLVTGLLAVGLWAFADEEPPKPDRLVVSTWGFNAELLQENLAEAFRDKYGIRIVFDFGNNADRLSRLVAHKKNPRVDVVTFAPNYAAMAKNEGVLQPLDPENISSLPHIVEWAQNPLGDYYGVGYTIQVFKLAYRTDKIDPPITSWRDFWRPELKGSITLPEMNTTYGPAVLLMAAKAWGGSVDDLEVGWEKLKELVETGALLTTYRRSSEAITMFEQGEVWLAPMPSFAWPMLKDTGLPLAWVTPASAYWEGLVASLNTLSVIEGTENKYWAEKFIDFWLSQEVQADMAMDLVDAPANTKVELPPDIEKRFGLDEDIENATFFDPEFIVSNLESWLDRWNKIVAK